jgi:hypothetical protein
LDVLVPMATSFKRNPVIHKYQNIDVSPIHLRTIRKLAMLCPKLTMRLFALLAWSATLSAQVAVTTHHNDLNRSGANQNETILNTSNVSVGSFGKLFSRTVDGQIYAQPLYVPNVTIPGQGVHNVVYVCTENNSVYAFDADNAFPSAKLWQVNFGPTANGVSQSIGPKVGITSTPVIDLASNTLYVVSESTPGGTPIFQLHALDITDGNEKFNGPVNIQGSVPGTGAASNNGILEFDPSMHWQRPGLLLLNGNVYIAFATHGDDTPPFHGWIFAYKATTLQMMKLLCTTPNGSDGGVWGGGQGLAADASGNIYVSTGNGTFDANSGGNDYGDSILKLGTASGLAILDYFSPSNESSLDGHDADLGSSGPLLIPGTSLGVAGGKDGRLFLFSTSNLGQFQATDQVIQEWQATFNEITGAGGIFGSDKVYYNSTLYLWGRNDALKAFAFNGTTFNTTPVSKTTFTIPDGYSNEPAVSISAQGTAPGTAILWAAYSANGIADGTANPGILRAFDASDLTHELWNSNQDSGRDYSGSWAKWCPPTIVNGKVYLATFDNVLNVYGLLGSASGSEGSLSGAGNSSAIGVNLTTEGPADWVHWGDASLNRKAGVTAQISDYVATGGSQGKYNNDQRPLSWSDGTPTVSATNDTNGVYIFSPGQGFTFTAPADTATRTLVVHVGGWNSAGKFTAHLSDGSAADFVDTTASSAVLYDRNYTLTYSAANANQKLTVTWLVQSGTGSVNLSGAALSGTAPPASITAIGGTPQTTSVGAAFAVALKAKVTDANNNPLVGLQVTFTAPSGGPSGSFNGSATAKVNTDSSGVATAPAFTANGQAGSYAVAAAVSGLASTASFNLTNNPVSGRGTLSGSVNSVTTGVNLTTEGPADWVHWGDASLNRKAGVTAQISNYVATGGSQGKYNNDQRPLSWSDGTPTVSATNDTNGVYIFLPGQGFTFTAPADTATRTLVVHVGGWNSAGKFTAHLSDGSAADFVDITVSSAGQYDHNYTLTYSAANANQNLTVNWVMTAGSGNVTLNGAALQ